MEAKVVDVPSPDAFGSRPGVCRVGVLSKEGGRALSRAFPSRRLFVLLENARLEYYEEKTSKFASRGWSDDDIANAVSLNEWNLVVYVNAGSPLADSLIVGDVLQTCNGVPLEGGLRPALAGSRAELQLLRPKGEVLVSGALIEAVGECRLRITVAKREQHDARPPYLLIAQDAATRDAWLEALQAVARAPRGAAEDDVVWRSASSTATLLGTVGSASGADSDGLAGGMGEAEQGAPQPGGGAS